MWSVINSLEVGNCGTSPLGLISAYSGSFRSNITKADSVLFAGEDTSFPANSTLILSHCFKLAFWIWPGTFSRKKVRLSWDLLANLVLFMLEISATGLENLTAIFQPPRTELITWRSNLILKLFGCHCWISCGTVLSCEIAGPGFRKSKSSHLVELGWNTESAQWYLWWTEGIRTSISRPRAPDI